MLTQIKIHINIEKVKNDDCTYSVKIYRSSTSFSNNIPVNTTPPTEYGQRRFKSEADSEIEKLNERFVDGYLT